MANQTLNLAKKDKFDEFYTKLSDIEKELIHYKEHFKDKIILCNCDDPKISNFYAYFTKHFKALNLKKLIITHFKRSKSSYKLEITQHTTTKTPLKTNGDFRNDEMIHILKEADIIVTNPPFSLLREYIKQLFDYKKQFLIVANINLATCKDIFPLIKENKMWLGYKNGSQEFIVPQSYEKNNAYIAGGGGGETS